MVDRVRAAYAGEWAVIDLTQMAKTEKRTCHEKK